MSAVLTNSATHRSVHPRCPCCEGRLKRVRRSLGDKLLSLLVPSFRYRCVAQTCRWEGVRRQR